MNTVTPKWYVGMDVSEKSIEFFFLPPDNEDGIHKSMPNSLDTLCEFCDALPDVRNVVVALETGTHSPWMSEYFENRGVKCFVGNARKLAAVWSSVQKSDRNDDETGLIYYNYRYYNPTLGRWLSRDPIGENGGENLYVFVTNNSIGNVDILGLRCCSEAQKQHCLDGLRDAWRKTKDAWDDFTRYDPVLDGIGGFPKHGGGTTKPKGHYIELTARFNGIKNSLEQFAECADCDNFNSPPKYPKKLDNWVNRPLPKPVTPNEPMPIIPTIPIPKTPPTPTIPVIDTILNFFDSLPIMGPIMILPNPEIFMPDFGSSYHGGGFA